MVFGHFRPMHLVNNNARITKFNKILCYNLPMKLSVTNQKLTHGHVVNLDKTSLQSFQNKIRVSKYGNFYVFVFYGNCLFFYFHFVVPLFSDVFVNSVLFYSVQTLNWHKVIEVSKKVDSCMRL